MSAITITVLQFVSALTERKEAVKAIWCWHFSNISGISIMTLLKGFEPFEIKTRPKIITSRSAYPLKVTISQNQSFQDHYMFQK